MPIRPFAFNPINIAARTATGLIPSDEDTILGSIICLTMVIIIYDIRRPKAAT